MKIFIEVSKGNVISFAVAHIIAVNVGYGSSSFIVVLHCILTSIVTFNFRNSVDMVCNSFPNRFAHLGLITMLSSSIFGHHSTSHFISLLKDSANRAVIDR